MRDGIFLYSSCGSPNYAAPELINGKYYNGSSIDIWSCGVILYTLLTGSLPFNEKQTAKLYQKIRECRYIIPENISDKAKDLIFRMLQKDPLNRISIAEIKQHKWFSNKLNFFQIIDNHKYIYGNRNQIDKDIIHLYEVIETKTEIILIMEYASGGELFDLLCQEIVIKINLLIKLYL